MTDNRHIAIILVITLIVLVVIGCRTKDSVMFALAYINLCALLGLAGKALLKRLGDIEEKENSKPV
jgi:hypothetical protein